MSVTLTDYSRRRDYLSLTVIWGWNTKVSQTFNKSPSVYKIPFISSAICCWHIKALYELFPCGERLHLYFISFSFFLLKLEGNDLPVNWRGIDLTLCSRMPTSPLGTRLIFTVHLKMRWQNALELSGVKQWRTLFDVALHKEFIAENSVDLMMSV